MATLLHNLLLGLLISKHLIDDGRLQEFHLRDLACRGIGRYPHLGLRLLGKRKARAIFFS
jgi:hypothetical protein